MNNKIPQKSYSIIFKTVFKEILNVLKLFLRKIEKKLRNEKIYGLSVLIIYVIIIIAFAFWYNSIYQTNPNNFLISNPDLNRNMKEQNTNERREPLKLIEYDIKIKQIEIDSMNSIRDALNLFDKSSNNLIIQDNIKPDSILYYGKHSFRLRLIKKSNINYLVNPTFENQTYQYEVYANYRKLLYYFSDDDDNSPINVNMCIKNKKTHKVIYFRQSMYYRPSPKKYIDIKTFYGRSILMLNYWINERLSEREKEYQELTDKKEEIITQLKDSGHYLSLWDFLYFSTITQSSTGYGDILPNSKLVRKVVTLQIILGLFVLGIVITFRPNKEN